MPSSQAGWGWRHSHSPSATSTTSTSIAAEHRLRERCEPAAPLPPDGRAAIARDGTFALPAVRLRKVADNSFVVTIDAPPNAPRKVDFSAICLDCLAGGPPAAD